MKNSLFTTVLFITLNFFAQNSGTGFVVEYSKNVDVQFQAYNPPKRINKVSKQNNIDYSQMSGLLQSYLSATNIDWARSEYLDPKSKIIRDQEHFTAVKNSNKNDYIQLENVYRFQYNFRDIAFIRYSHILEDLPFPFVGILSLEKSNGRWFISTILNQSELYFILKNFENDVILDFFRGDSENKKLKQLIENSLNSDFNLITAKLHKNLKKLQIEDKTFYDSLRDQRMMIEETKFRNAIVNSQANKYSFKNIFQTFVYDNFNFIEYENKFSNIVADEKSLKRFASAPEGLLLSDIPIDLVSKVKITETNGVTYFIVYNKNNIKRVAEIRKQSEGVYEVLESNNYNSFVKILKLMKTSFLVNVFNKTIDREIQSAIYPNEKSNLNIDLLIRYVLNNKTSLSQYLDE